MNGEPQRTRDGYRCPCGRELESTDEDIGETASYCEYECPNGHRWERESLRGFNDRWTRLGVTA